MLYKTFSVEVTCTVTSVQFLDDIVNIIGSNSNIRLFQMRYELVPDYCGLALASATFYPDQFWLMSNTIGSTDPTLEFLVDPPLSNEYNSDGALSVTLELELEN